MIKTSARPAAEGFRSRKRAARVWLRSGPRDPESEADAPLSDPVGGRGAGGGCRGGCQLVRPRGTAISATVGRRAAASVRVELPECVFIKVTAHGAAPPPPPKPPLGGQGLSRPGSGLCLLLASLPDLLPVRAGAQGLCPRPVPASQPRARPCHADWSPVRF